ncbi:BURP domain-containing protein 6-like isoform X1 [Elaeis guineensis]|uniref:BURP domain-containing protein 6-like isoform X1 n=1 Tax=Elaeis guineensis var. tenera TaxID=51953 RepID=UPI003C6D2CC7
MSARTPLQILPQIAVQCTPASLPSLLRCSTLGFLIHGSFPSFSFYLCVGACHAALPADVYWNSVLPNTPIPSAIRHVIRSGVFVDDMDSVCAFFRYAATQSQIQDPSVTVFFLEKDLHPGANMTFHFTRTTTGATLLPRELADSIPFSSAKLPEILSRLSIAPDSVQAETMKKILLECEEPAIDGEIRYCATSVESMVDFSTSSLGTRNVEALSTTVDRKAPPKQVYTISKVQKLPTSKLVVCHSENYAYAVFHCHTACAEAYKVSMVGKDGTKVEAVAACHTDTAGFNPEHVAFKVLNVKPGTVPICQFQPQNDIIWSPNTLSISPLEMVV